MRCRRSATSFFPGAISTLGGTSERLAAAHLSLGAIAMLGGTSKRVGAACRSNCQCRFSDGGLSPGAIATTQRNVERTHALLSWSLVVPPRARWGYAFTGQLGHQLLLGGDQRGDQRRAQCGWGLGDNPDWCAQGSVEDLAGRFRNLEGSRNSASACAGAEGARARA